MCIQGEGIPKIKDVQRNNTYAAFLIEKPIRRYISKSTSGKRPEPALGRGLVEIPVTVRRGIEDLQTGGNDPPRRGKGACLMGGKGKRGDF